MGLPEGHMDTVGLPEPVRVVEGQCDTVADPEGEREEDVVTLAQPEGELVALRDCVREAVKEEEELAEAE